MDADKTIWISYSTISTAHSIVVKVVYYPNHEQSSHDYYFNAPVYYATYLSSKLDSPFAYVLIQTGNLTNSNTFNKHSQRPAL